MSKITEDEARSKLKNKHPEWKLIEFSKYNGKCTLEHCCGNQKEYASLNVTMCMGPVCEKCKEPPQINWKYNVGDHIIDENRDLVIINRKVVDEIRSKKKAKIKYYQYHCNKCGYECGENYFFGEYNEDHWIEQSSIGGKVGCAVCGHRIIVPGINDIATKKPHWIRFFKEPKDATKYGVYSRSVIKAICPKCGRERESCITSMQDSGIGCICSDMFSYPEKFIYSMLDQLGLNFIYQLSKTTFKWCKNKRYDFYIKGKNIIVETHGCQHFYESPRGRTLQDEQSNDELKMKMAFENGFTSENYIVLDCRKSDIDKIKEAVVNSQLLNKLGFTEYDVDWYECNNFATNNMTKLLCEFWESYKTEEKQELNTKIIADHFKISQSSILRHMKVGRDAGWCDFLTRIEKSHLRRDNIIQLYLEGMNVTEIMKKINTTDRHIVINALNYGTEHGLCEYNGKQALINANLTNSPVARCVKCIELDICFQTITAAEKYIGTKIYAALNNPRWTAKGYHWTYITKEEYHEWTLRNSASPS